MMFGHHQDLLELVQRASQGSTRPNRETTFSSEGDRSVGTRGH